MNIEQLMEARDRVKKIMDDDETLIDFVKVVDAILTKPYKHVCKGLKTIDFKELDDEITRMENIACELNMHLAVKEFGGWADTLDIVTNPQEMKLLKNAVEIK